MSRHLLLLILLLFVVSLLEAQTSLSGKVTDAETAEPIIFSTVALYKNDVLITGTESDVDGNYSFSNIDPGTYDLLVSYTGYNAQRVTDIQVLAVKIAREIENVGV